MTKPAAKKRPSVRFSTNDFDGLYFGDILRGYSPDGNQIVAHVNDLRQCMATDLLRAMRRSDNNLSSPISGLEVSEVDEKFFDEEVSDVSQVYFERIDNSLTLRIDFLVDDWEDDDDERELIRRSINPLLKRNRMIPLEIWQDEWWSVAPWLWHARIGFNVRNRTLGELYSVGQDAVALMHALQGGPLTRQNVGDLVRAGRPHILIGQREGHWLDVKSQHYDLANDHGQISLAQSVARFCNSEAGGLVIFGMSTRRVPGGEEIRGINPLPQDGRMSRRYQQTLEKRLFPPPDNLSVESISVGTGQMIMLIDVPPQPEELKPFLVHGAIVEGRVEGAFISIVRRRGEDSIPITAPMIHSTLAAGRALLRRGELPTRPDIHQSDSEPRSPAQEEGKS